jgi:polysaccharide pyruvyl transferase WcaK-like protein
MLRKKYKQIYFWPQGLGDLDLLASLNYDLKDIVILPSNLSYFKNFCETYDFDYVGTRLHAGILAIEKTHRSLIIGVDNRAREIAKDINIPIVDKNIREIADKIEGEFSTDIKIPTDKINEWKSQFNPN